MVLAGGQGTRARAINPGTPKPLLPIQGTPAVTLQARWLATRASCPPVEVIVLSGHQGDRVAAALPRFTEHTPVATVRTMPRGTVAALRCGLGAARTDHVLCLNCDTIVG
jgi:NDP-sugar pyrophosphorylase family protein